jgi:hypothetical protein
LFIRLLTASSVSLVKVTLKWRVSEGSFKSIDELPELIRFCFNFLFFSFISGVESFDEVNELFVTRLELRLFCIG